MLTDINPCYALAIKGDYPFDDGESFLQVQFWCETEELCYPERWLAVPKSRASRFTKEAINERLLNKPEYVPDWDGGQLRLSI